MSNPPDSDKRNSDAILLERIKSNDPKAFEELVDQYKGLVLNLVSRMSGRIDNAEDLAQEVFVRVWKGLPKFRGECQLSTWIYRIALNLSIAESKSARARSLFLQVDDPAVARGPQFWVEQSNPYAEEVVLKERMGRLLVHMPEKHRTAVTLFYLKSLSYIEISEIMDVPVGTVKSYLFRGKAWLRERLLGGTEETKDDLQDE
jgi:RNA polymerase sigma-70 factor (ECF subfamily)